MTRGRVILLFVTAAIALPAAVARADTSVQFVRFATSLGNIDVQLQPQYAPKTVSNFLAYVNSGAYAATFLHRSVAGFILQGGGYELRGGTVDHIPQQPAVVNEFGLSNIRGTLAMAKLPTNPNSATDEWFFNLADNSANLDAQNGGFTVFGRVLSPAGLAVMDTIAAEPTAAASSTLAPADFANLTAMPVQNWTSGQPVIAPNLVMSPVSVLIDTAAPTISISEPAAGQHFALGQSVTPQFACDDASGTGVATCAASRPVATGAPGTYTFTVSASDYAGNAGARSIDYVVDAPPLAPVVPAVTPVSPLAPAVTPASPLAPAPSPARAPGLVGSLHSPPTGPMAINLRCAASIRCAGHLTVSLRTGSGRRARTLELGAGRYSVPARGRTKLSLRLARGASAALRHGTRFNASISFVPTGGRSQTTKAQLVVTRR